MNKRLIKVNKLILIIIIIIFNKSYSQNLTQQEINQYTELIVYIEYVYKKVSNVVEFLYKYKNYRLSSILWYDLSRYSEYLPSVSSKTYNDPKGLIMTLWGIDDNRYLHLIIIIIKDHLLLKFI